MITTIEALTKELAEVEAKKADLEARIEGLKAATTELDDERRELSNLGLSDDEVEIVMQHRHPSKHEVLVTPVDPRQISPLGGGWYPSIDDRPAGFVGGTGSAGIPAPLTHPTVYDDGKSDVTHVRDALADGLWRNSFALQAAAALDHHRTTKAVRKLIKDGVVEQRGMKRQCEYHLIITTSGQ